MLYLEYSSAFERAARAREISDVEANGNGATDGGQYGRGGGRGGSLSKRDWKLNQQLLFVNLHPILSFAA